MIVVTEPRYGFAGGPSSVYLIMEWPAFPDRGGGWPPSRLTGHTSHSPAMTKFVDGQKSTL
jgi:hypothetical protein